MLAFATTAADAEKTLPSSTFNRKRGFYYNPEVAAFAFLRATTRRYDFVWLLESDVRWTVRGRRLPLTYHSCQAAQRTSQDGTVTVI